MTSAHIESAGPHSFPIRVAAIDVGSNAIRSLAAEFAGPDRFSELASERVAVRLGHGAFLNGHLTPDAIDSGVDALIFLRRRLNDLGIVHYRAVATSAVRESRNAREFTGRVLRESGIHLESIPPAEEARLVWVAVRHRIALEGEPWILADLGGGSVEVSVVDDTVVRHTESHGLGAVRLLEEFPVDARIGDAYYQRLQERVSALVLPALSRRPAGLIATGGNIEVLAWVAHRMPEENEVSELPVDTLCSLGQALARLPFSERINRYGLRDDRADVIVPAAVVYARLAELAGTDRILVPFVGVRHGILVDLVQQLTPPSRGREQ